MVLSFGHLVSDFGNPAQLAQGGLICPSLVDWLVHLCGNMDSGVAKSEAIGYFIPAGLPLQTRPTATEGAAISGGSIVMVDWGVAPFVTFVDPLLQSTPPYPCHNGGCQLYSL